MAGAAPLPAEQDRRPEAHSQDLAVQTRGCVRCRTRVGSVSPAGFYTGRVAAALTEVRALRLALSPLSVRKVRCGGQP